MTRGRAVSAEGDPFGIAEAQALVAARTAERDAAIVATVRAGATHRDAAELFGLTPPRVTQIVTAARDREWNVSAAAAGKVSAPTHASMAEEMRLAVHAQALRAESATGGAARELRAFYGHPDESPADVVEAPLTLARARAEHTARLAHEREQAEAYRLRAARRGTRTATAH